MPFRLSIRFNKHIELMSLFDSEDSVKVFHKIYQLIANADPTIVCIEICLPKLVTTFNRK